MSNLRLSLTVSLAVILVANCHAEDQTRWVTAGAANGSSLYTPGMATPADPELVVGNDKCVKCHESEIKVWTTTPHAMTFTQLHRTPEAKQIASKLGLRSIKHSGRCVACHYTQQTDAHHGTTSAIAGVSCESCHGAAKNWLDLHHNYGGEQITRATESAQHRAKRIADSIHAGMRNPTNVYLVAQSCLRCHTTADEELVNVGGHTAGSLKFEFVSWSQGTIRHNFLDTDGKSNAQRSPEKLRVMFVAGMIAELEASLRATAVATQKATFGVTSAKRADRSMKRLQSVNAKISSQHVNKILQICDSIKLKLNNKQQLTSAANQIAELGTQFAAQSDGSDLSALDAYIPKGRK